ncbi:MAG TPA: acetoacetate decarboxylase family protein [Chitinophagales bacterium]|nr:acetoacetate decarboxylase family protein [Chitinophagales bacterium]
MTLAHYAETNGQILTSQPFQVINARFYTFAFKGSISKELCDRWFTNPSGGSVEASSFLPLVIISFCDYTEGCSIPQRYKGKIDYHETLFTTFVRLKNGGSSVVYAFAPYLFLNNASAIAAGREIYGMPKTWGWIKIPAAANPDYFSAETEAFFSYSPDNHEKTDVLVEIKLLSDSFREDAPVIEDDMEKIWTDLQEDYNKSFPDERAEADLCRQLRDFFSHRRFPFVSLKQFPDIEDGSKACYQSIVGFSMKIDKIKIKRLKGPYVLTLTSCDQFPIGKDLGLSSGQKTLFSRLIEWNFVFEAGKELWKAP